MPVSKALGEVLLHLLFLFQLTSPTHLNFKQIAESKVLGS